ncbi:MAG TPA: nucleoid-associated protein, partial [Bacteroidales bacterium]|nr:nucleoid-associated protein [Bacteroidales bacterium]
ETEEGININKLDKGCLIFNIEPENGYTVSVVDQINRGSESKFWSQLFLNLKPKEDLYFHTQQALTLCKEFINQELPEQIEINRAQQVDLLQRSVEYFKENDQFEQEQFKEQVLVEPEVIQSFEQFQEQRAADNQLLPLQQFEISEKAVKRETKYIRSVIKLDKNFHIYVHGDRKLIEQGNEMDGRKYYKLYFEEEK